MIDVTNYRSKTDEEIAFIRRAQEITDAAFAMVIPKIKQGMTEIDIAKLIESSLEFCGSEGMAFPVIVGFGKNALDPHAAPTTRKLKPGHMILMDFGAKYKGYCADMTRTVAFKHATETQKRIYNAVLEAQINTILQLKAGAVCEEIHLFAKEELARHNLACYFTHGTGHGVGQQVHEAPSFHRYDKNCPKDIPLAEYKKTGTRLLHNSVVTVEPGVYYNTWFKKIGVRIEDLILITDKGVENLTKSPKELLVVGE